MIYTKAFWKDVFERAVSTFVQFLVVLFGANAAADNIISGYTGYDWKVMGSLALAGAITSVLKALGASFVKTNESVATPSFVKYEETVPVTNEVVGTVDDDELPIEELT